MFVEEVQRSSQQRSDVSPESDDPLADLHALLPRPWPTSGDRDPTSAELCIVAGQVDECRVDTGRGPGRSAVASRRRGSNGYSLAGMRRARSSACE